MDSASTSMKKKAKFRERYRGMARVKGRHKQGIFTMALL
jgi:hypothetical protein